MDKIIKNINIVNYDSIIFGDIIIEKNKIIKIIKKSDKENKKNNYCIPGFIDQHTHGGYGISFDNIYEMDNNKLNDLKEKLSKEGVCGVFLTTVTQEIEKIKEIGKFLNTPNNLIIGWHIEGPFISEFKKGAHDNNYIIDISKTLIKEIDNTNRLKKIITIAPEINNALKIIKENKCENIFFSIGHSNANYEICKKAINYGATQFTHLYNAMSGFDHRNPGIVNFALNDKNSFLELITDGVHVNDNVLYETFNICSPNRIIIVSDSLPSKGLQNGLYHLGSLKIEKKDNQCYLAGSNTLAGSTMKYISVVKHFKKITNCNMSDIVKMTSYNTSKQFKLKDRGIIKEGIKADLIICDDKLNIIETTF